VVVVLKNYVVCPNCKSLVSRYRLKHGRCFCLEKPVSVRKFERREFLDALVPLFAVYMFELERAVERGELKRRFSYGFTEEELTEGFNKWLAENKKLVLELAKS